MIRDHFRVLVVDLGTGRGNVVAVDGRDSVAGGSGLAAHLFLKYGKPDRPWNDPEQPLIFAIGPLTGYFPLMSKTVCAFKSPYHDQYAESHGGGRSGLSLRFVISLGRRNTWAGVPPEKIDAYMKAVWRGFPWSEYVRTRIGFGIGLSYATRVPYVEAVSQAKRGRETSKLLNYLDPSIDINLGDVFRAKSLRETWFGIGVSHRSGVFGSSELLGNTDGGSNYLYTYIETSF